VVPIFGKLEAQLPHFIERATEFLTLRATVTGWRHRAESMNDCRRGKTAGV
jgi:hypothetical protein